MSTFRTGDVLIFYPINGNREHEVLTWLAKSQMVHVAIVDEDPDYLIEHSPPKIRRRLISDRIKHRVVDILRIIPNCTETNLLLARSAQKYLSLNLPFSTSLSFAAAIMFSRSDRDYCVNDCTFITEIILSAIQDIDKISSEMPLMLCSTLVSQCFIDAKVDLALVPETLPLAFIDKMIALLSAELPDQDELPAPQVSLTSLLQQPSQHLKQHSAQMLAKASLKLARVLCQRLNLPVGEGVLDALLTLKQHQAMFISPNDLLVNARALAHVGQIITP